MVIECGCGKRLKAPDGAGGKVARCPACGKGLIIPMPEIEEDLGEIPLKDEVPAAPDAVRSQSTQAPIHLPPPVPPAHGVYVREKSAGRTEAAANPLGGPARPVWRQYLYFLLLLALIPLAVSMLSERRDIGARFEKTVEEHKDEIKQYVQSHSASSEDEDGFEVIMAALPNGRIDGALLPRQTWMHWLFAGVSAAAFLTLLVFLFPSGEARTRDLIINGVFTGTVGIILLLALQWIADWTQGYWVKGRGILVLLFYVVKFIGFSYRAALDADTSFILSFLGFTFGVGLCEELCKALPIFWYLQKSNRVSWRSVMLWGLASGVGFGISEGIHYSSNYYNGLHEGNIYVVRFASCVALHAVWSATVALSMYGLRDHLESSDWIVALFRAMILPMLLHGLYDTLLKKDMELYALLTAFFSFGLLVWQVERFKRNAGEEEMGHEPALA
jgi:RsiW-degrading membrane proteinase PrsW (M82 family)